MVQTHIGVARIFAAGGGEVERVLSRDVILRFGSLRGYGLGKGFLSIKFLSSFL